jgi:hypothetical protein
MNKFEKQNELLKEIKELADTRYGNQLAYVGLWGSASALLTVEQLEIIKSVMENK